MIDLLSASPWQMTFGERAALEGILTQLKPGLSIEIGTAEGGSLGRIAAHSSQVHSFDLVEPSLSGQPLSNVTLHTGDSHALLPAYLAELASAGQNVDFVLVDGDHAADGVRRDLDDLLSSSAVGHCLVLVHDTANEIVREGIEHVDFAAHSKVKHVDLEFVGGHLSRGGAFHHELWGGIGLIVIDSELGAQPFGGPQEGDFYSSFELLAAVRDGLVESERAGGGSSLGDVTSGGRADEVEHLRHELAAARKAVSDLERSASWKLTSPLRSGKQAIRSRLRG